MRWRPDTNIERAEDTSVRRRRNTEIDNSARLSVQEPPDAQSALRRLSMPSKILITFHADTGKVKKSLTTLHAETVVNFTQVLRTLASVLDAGASRHNPNRETLVDSEQNSAGASRRSLGVWTRRDQGC